MTREMGNSISLESAASESACFVNPDPEEMGLVYSTAFAVSWLLLVSQSQSLGPNNLYLC